MNVSREADSSEEILYINFNQTSTALCVGSKTGYTLYDLQTVYECKPTFESRNLADICIIERSFSTSLVAYVRLEKPRNLVLYNYTKGTVIVERNFPNTVLSVKLNRNNVVVCLEDTIYVMNVKAMSKESIHVLTHTAPNLKGLIALTYGPETNPSLLAYPGSSANGNVQIFDACNKHATMTIPAHTTQLAAIAFDEEGEKLATASIKGTVIRVFSVATGEILFEFRRGVKRCVEIQSLSFSKNPDLLSAASNTETIHIFKLCAPAEATESVEEEAEGWMEMFGRVLTQSAKYLPTQMSDVLTQQRSFAHIHLPIVNQKAICAVTHINQVPYVIVASFKGILYIYDINTEVGGACHLVKQHRLEGPRPERRSSISSLSSSPKLKNALLNPKPLQSNTGSEMDPTTCLNPQVINNTQEDDTPFLSCRGTGVSELNSPISSIPELCTNNGIHTMGDELPPILTEVEQ